jgi:hypothetical protein
VRITPKSRFSRDSGRKPVRSRNRRRPRPRIAVERSVGVLEYRIVEGPDCTSLSRGRAAYCAVGVADAAWLALGLVSGLAEGDASAAGPVWTPIPCW